MKKIIHFFLVCIRICRNWHIRTPATVTLDEIRVSPQKIINERKWVFKRDGAGRREKDNSKYSPIF